MGRDPHRPRDQRRRLLRAGGAVRPGPGARRSAPPREPAARPAWAPDVEHERAPRGARGRRWPVGRRGRVLARVGGSRRPPRREEDVPAREDVRRRAHAPSGAAAPRHGARRATHGLPPLQRPPRTRARHHARARVARAPRPAVVRIRRAPSRPRPDGRRQRGEGRSDRLARRRGDRADPRERPRARRHRQRTRGAREVRGGRGRRELALRSRDRHGARSLVPAGDGDPRLLREPAPRGPVDREPRST